MITCLSLVQVTNTTGVVELNILAYDIYFFSQSFLPISSGLRIAVDFMSGIVELVASELLYYTVVVKLHIAA